MLLSLLATKPSASRTCAACWLIWLPTDTAAMRIAVISADGSTLALIRTTGTPVCVVLNAVAPVEQDTVQASEALADLQERMPNQFANALKKLTEAGEPCRTISNTPQRP